MKWSSAVSENPNLEKAVRECSEKIEKELQKPADLTLFFASPHHQRSYTRIASLLSRALRPKYIMGCSAGGVIGDSKEIEQKPGISVTAALMPEVNIKPFYVDNDSLPDLDARPKAWHDLVGITPDKEPHFILLIDPFSIDAEKFAVGMDYAFQKSVKIGGLSSGARRPGENILVLNDEYHHEGLVGIALSGDILIDPIVAQGCRPIGEPMIVTTCRHNVLLELDKKSPIKVLEEVFESLSQRDQHLFRTSLFLGIVMDSSKSSHSFGDFLIRNIVGVDAENGVIAVSSELREGQKVQFHLRDAQTSAEDLSHMLTQYSEKNDKNDARGALLFSCLGRGVYLYGSPNHDTNLFQKSLGAIPLGGFFCNGEIGPVNNTTYIHGYTSCFGIFREKQK